MTDDLRTNVALEMGRLMLAKIEAETAVQQLLREKQEQMKPEQEQDNG